MSDLAITALRTPQFGSFMFGNVLDMLEHLAALSTAVLIGGHGSLLHMSGGTESSMTVCNILLLGYWPHVPDEGLVITPIAENTQPCDQALRHVGARII